MRCSSRPMLPLPSAQHRIREQHQRSQRNKRWLLKAIDGVVTASLLSWVILQICVWNTPLPRSWFQKGTISLQLLDRDGRFLHEQPADNDKFGAWLPQQALPTTLKLMTLAAEDHRIHKHPGVDAFAVLRAIYTNLTSTRRRSGASTLAMQLVRQYKPAKRTYTNKIKEMYWALVLRDRLGVNGIVREYLNRAPYGNRVQGVQRASMLYFDRPASDLSFGQAAFLAALPWGPGYLNPFHKKGAQRARNRAHLIIKRAWRLGWLTDEQQKEALSDPIHIQPKPKRHIDSIHWTQRIIARWKQTPRHRQPEKRINAITTTLDLHLQTKAVQALKEQLGKLTSASAGSAMVVDHRSGEILAYVGSPSYFAKQARGAIDYIQSPRAPGSTLKPFIYAQGIQQAGFTGATLLQDLAHAFLWKHGVYQPNNHDEQYLGPVTLRKALGNSRNIPVLHVLARLGVTQAVEYLRSLGFHSLKQSGTYYGLGLALGSAEVTLEELVGAYAILARDGSPLTFRWSRAAVDSLGRPLQPGKRLKALFRATNRTPQLSPSVARVLKHMLSDPAARLPSFQRHGWLEFPFPVAVKTGTSQGHRDAWMVAVSDRVVVGCWVGNHNRRKMVGVYGSKGCGPIVHTLMKEAMKRVSPQQKPTDFAHPKGWQQQAICPLSGLPASKACPGTTDEWFPPGHLHKHKTCPFHKRLTIDTRNGLLATAACPSTVLQDKLFVVVPSQYDQWASAVGLSTPPHHKSPLCQRASNAPKDFSLTIREPIDRARYMIDPTIPTQYATIALQAESNHRPKEIIWHRNGKPIGRSSWPYRFRWTMVRGKHHFHATSTDGRIQSQVVQITVY